MTDIVPPATNLPIVDTSGNMLTRFRDWTQFITRAVNFATMAEGSGSPETVLAAAKNKFYNDTTGNALYWKSVNDIAGDATKGWLLVV